ncbi:mobilization protein [Rhizobium sp. DKSPLA3]|uniref:Mobilization protein n=1 Tax=Rhizobium quercicola TaxID=2901226 RepID=A0A9X1NSJ8_9HYPH|nr:mobilization protein [Rhizobium quercicola]MCD7109643.1 mobilization protein [Rhizobium quercicola]
MARKSIGERLAQIEAQRKTLKARLGKQERSEETRRKILLGALVLHRLQTSGNSAFTRQLDDWLRRELPGFLTREADHALFADLLQTDPLPSSPLASDQVTTSSTTTGSNGADRHGETEGKVAP